MNSIVGIAAENVKKGQPLTVLMNGQFAAAVSDGEPPYHPNCKSMIGDNVFKKEKPIEKKTKAELREMVEHLRKLNDEKFKMLQEYRNKDEISSDKICELRNRVQSLKSSMKFLLDAVNGAI